jgi:hypothetical protein
MSTIGTPIPGRRADPTKARCLVSLELGDHLGDLDALGESPTYLDWATPAHTGTPKCSDTH